MTKYQRFLYNGTLLALTSLCIRGIGVLFNRYLSVHIGPSGLGQFSLLMSVWGFAVTAASAGIHLALTRVVSESDDRAEERYAVQCGLRYSSIVGSGACILLWLLAPVIGNRFLGFEEAVPALRMLALALPPLSLSTTISGYFVAVRHAYKGAAIGVFGQVIRIGVTVFALRVLSMRGAWPCYALAAGAVASEYACFFLSLIAFLPQFRRRTRDLRSGLRLPDPDKRRRITRYVLHIAQPIAAAACIRSGLSTLQNLLIPIGLERSGAASVAALSAYGTMHGLVLPILLLPAAVLSSYAGLLIPEISALRAHGRHDDVRSSASCVLRITVCVSLFVCGCLLCDGARIGAAVGGNAEAGQYLRAAAALVPIMYLDSAVDAFLKSLDAQMDSMRYNVMDAAFCVVMAYLLLPPLGITGYILLLYLSELFNLGLSLGRLIGLTGLHIPLMEWIGKPVAAVIGACTASVFFFRSTGITYRFAATDITVHILVCAVFYLLFLALLGIIGKHEVSAFRRMFFPAIKLPLAKRDNAWYNKNNAKQRNGYHHAKRNPTQHGRSARRL